MSLHKILVPINYSPCSLNGLRYAGHLAKELHAKIVILHALNNDKITSASELEKEKEKQTLKIQKYCTEESSVADIMTDIFVSGKSALEAIASATEIFDIDLMVMGTEGTEKSMKELVGSFTYHVIEKSKVPVLSVPDGNAFIPIQLIGFGVDYKQVEESSALRVLRDFAFSCQSRLEIFHIHKYGEEHEFLEPHETAKLDTYFKGLTHSFENVESKSITEGLNKYIKKANPNLVVLVPRKYSFFEWLNHESISEEAVQHLKIPVLIIPERG